MNELKTLILDIPFHWPLIITSVVLLGLVSIVFIASSKCREEQNTWANLISWSQLKCLHQFPCSDVFSGSVFPSQLVAYRSPWDWSVLQVITLRVIFLRLSSWKRLFGFGCRECLQSVPDSCVHHFLDRRWWKPNWVWSQIHRCQLSDAFGHHRSH